MSGGFEEAKERRNWLERLGARIPGFRGYQDRELRRDVDRMQREHLGKELGSLKNEIRGRVAAYTDEGKLGSLHLFDRLERRLDGLSQSVRFSDYGASGFFDVVKIKEPELESLYQFDLSLLEDIAALESAVGAIPEPGQGDPEGPCKQALERLAAVEDKWASRENVISGVVRASR